MAVPSSSTYAIYYEYHPLIAPNIIPFTKYFCNMGYGMILFI